MKQLNFRLISYPLLTTVIGIGFAVMYFIYPYLNDDIWYLDDLSLYVANPSFKNYLSSVGDTLYHHYMTDNGRLANILGVIVLPLAKWVPAALCGAFVSLSIYLTSLLADCWKKCFISFSVIASFWVLAFPWADHMFHTMFGFNYLLPSCLILLSTHLFLNKKLKGIIVPVILGFILGASHEIFSCTAISGVVPLLLFFKDYRTRSNCLYLLSLILGLIYLLHVPGVYVRSSDFEMFKGFAQPLVSAQYAAPLYLMLIIGALSYSSKKWRLQIDSAFVVSFFTMAIVAWCIWRSFFTGLRTSWCMDVISTAGIAYLIARCPLFEKKRLKLAANIFGCTFIALSIADIIACLPWFVRMNKEVSDCRELQRTSDGGVIFYDLTTPDLQPIYTLAKPNFNVYSQWNSKLIEVLPKAFSHFSPLQAQNLGDTENPLYLYHGNIAMPYTEDLENKHIIINIDYGNIIYENVARLVPFTGADNKQYLFWKINLIPIRYSRLPIRGAKIVGLYED